MSLLKPTIAIRCDSCGEQFMTSSTTGAGARGDAERLGWRVAHLAGGMHTKRSSHPRAPDICPHCRSDRPAPEPDLFSGGIL